MKKIRDFIYDYNDVLVALVIIAAAAAIIFWRVQTVLAYSAKTSQEVTPKKTTEVDISDIDLTPETVYDVQPIPPEEEDDDTDGDNSAAEDPKDNNPAQAIEYVTITIDDDSATWGKAADKLFAESLIEDKNSFIETVKSLKLTSSLRKGTYKIPVGTEDEDIAKILAKKK